jgi:hypothetical protein
MLCQLQIAGSKGSIAARCTGPGRPHSGSGPWLVSPVDGAAQAFTSVAGYGLGFGVCVRSMQSLIPLEAESRSVSESSPNVVVQNFTRLTWEFSWLLI